MDGHSSHIDFEASAYCRENNVVLYCLLANATHILQPCDVGFFRPMKASWKREVQNWQNSHTGQSLAKQDFPGVFKTAFQNVAEILLVKNAFQRFGLYPFLSQASDKSRLGPSVMVVYPPVERATANLSFRPTSPATMSAATATSTSAAPVVLLDRTPTIPAASTKYIPVAASNKSTILPVTKALPLTLPLTKNRQYY